MGRTPKPTQLKRLQGNPGHRKLGKDEPTPAPGTPECPETLTGEARKEWGRICTELETLNLLTLCDRSALAAYCYWWGEFTAGAKELAKTKRSKDQAEIKRQSIRVRDASMEMRSYMMQFGLTPAARTKIKVEKPAEESDYEQFLRGNDTPARN